MIDEIITELDFLRQLSEETTRKEIEKLKLPSRLMAAASQAWTQGCGLAAIQIGIPLRYACFIFKGKFYELINPEIIFQTGLHLRKEGCLSVPRQWPQVERYSSIEYISEGKKHRAKDVKAHIIQHEIDHMNGVLNIDMGGEIA